MQEKIDQQQKANRKLEAELDDKRIDYEKFKVPTSIIKSVGKYSRVFKKKKKKKKTHRIRSQWMFLQQMGLCVPL